MNAEIAGVKSPGRISARGCCVTGLILSLLAWAVPLPAVTFDQQAERLQLIYTYLLDYRPVQGPVLSRKSTFELALELTPTPSIDNRVGAKNEPVDPPALIPRPRARFHFASGMVLGAAYTPPIEVSGYQAELAAVEAGFRFPLGNWRVGLRAYGLDGKVVGPITEPSVADRFQFTNLGADALFGLQMGFWLPYLGVGRGTTRSTLEIESDGVKLMEDSGYTYLLAGLTVDMENLRFTVEQSSTESVLDHYTISLSWVF